MQGVLFTRVGYAGGSTPNPTYHAIKDHTEVVEVHFDPTVITYMELLQRFWRDHNAGSAPWSRQYMSLLICNSPEQYLAARGVGEQVKSRSGGQLFTEIHKEGRFYRAEDYHQKYRLQAQHDLITELKPKYPNIIAMLDSPTATRLNAYLGGGGSPRQLKEEIKSFDLSETGQRILLKSIR